MGGLRLFGGAGSELRVGPSLPHSYPYFTRISANLSKFSITNHALWNKINTIIYYPTYGVPGSAFINGENREDLKNLKKPL